MNAQIIDKILDFDKIFEQLGVVNLRERINQIYIEIETLLDPFDKDELFIELIKVLSRHNHIEVAVNILEKVFDEDTQLIAIELISKSYPNIQKTEISKIEEMVHRLKKISEKMEEKNKTIAEKSIEKILNLNGLTQGKRNKEYIDTFMKEFFNTLALTKSKSSYDDNCFTKATALLDMAKILIREGEYTEAYEAIKNEDQFYCRNYSKNNDWCISSYINTLAQLYIQLNKHEKAFNLYKKYSECKIEKSIREQLRVASFEFELSEYEQLQEYEEDIVQLLKHGNSSDAFNLFDKAKDNLTSGNYKFSLLDFIFEKIIENKELFLKLKNSVQIEHYLEVLYLLNESIKKESFPFGEVFKLSHHYTAFGYSSKSNNILNEVLENNIVQEDLTSYSPTFLSRNYGSMAHHLSDGYLANANIVKMLEIYNTIHDTFKKDSISNSICEYYIKNKEFHKALKIIKMTSASSSYIASCVGEIIIGFLNNDHIDSAVKLLDAYKNTLGYADNDQEVFLAFVKKYIESEDIQAATNIINNYNIPEETKGDLLIELVKYYLEKKLFPSFEDTLLEYLNIDNLHKFIDIYDMVENSLNSNLTKIFADKLMEAMQKIDFDNSDEVIDMRIFALLYLRLNHVDKAINLIDTINKEIPSYLTSYDSEEDVLSEIIQHFISLNQIPEAYKLVHNYGSEDILMQSLAIHYAKKNNLEEVKEILKTTSNRSGNFPSRVINEFLKNDNVPAAEEMLNILNFSSLYQDQEKNLFYYYLKEKKYDKLFDFIQKYNITNTELIEKFIEVLIQDNKLDLIEKKIENFKENRTKLSYYHILINKLYSS